MSMDEVLRELTAAADEDLGRLLLRAFRAVNASVVELLANLGHDGVRPAHSTVFMNLDLTGTRLATLAQRAGVSRQAMSQLVHDLQQSGYLTVEPDPDDGRASLVRLTAQGEAFCRQAAEAVREFERQWRDLLGRNDLGQDNLDLLRAWLRMLARPPA